MTSTDQPDEGRNPAPPPPHGTVSPGVFAREQQIAAVQERVGELVGVANGTSAALVDLVADALEEDLWAQWGVHSPTHWLAWRAGMSKSRAQVFVQVARRRDELPATIAAMRAGLLSIDQVQVIARHVPAAYEKAAADLAQHLTVSQLHDLLPRYAWDPDVAGDGDPGEGDGAEDDGGAGGDAAATGDAGRAGGDGQVGGDSEGDGDVGGGAGYEEKRRGHFGWDDTGHGRLSALLPTDEAMLLETALKAARAGLLSRHRREQPGEAVPWFTDADSLMALVRSYLDSGALAHPGSDRYLVHAHLDQHPDGTPVLRSHLGPVVPDVLRRYLTCDCEMRPVFATDGVALSVGRTQRLVPDRARKVVEQRDRGCIVPGCGRRLGLDIHHIVHWEDGGRTDTSNLCCLCRTHHRQHHLGLIGITGDADRAGGLTVTDRWGKVMEAAAAPTPVDPAAPPHVAAAERDISHIPYEPASGERLNHHEVWLSPKRPPKPERDPHPSPAEPPEPRPPDPRPPDPMRPDPRADDRADDRPRPIPTEPRADDPPAA